MSEHFEIRSYTTKHDNDVWFIMRLGDVDEVWSAERGDFFPFDDRPDGCGFVFADAAEDELHKSFPGKPYRVDYYSVHML